MEKTRFKIVNWFYFWLGVCLLLLVKIKHKAQGYKSPKPFSVADVERCIDYDARTVEDWLGYLTEYTGEADYCIGRHVLELGPGSDLGIGLILLARGACQYSAVDANNLVASVPADFYNSLFKRLTPEFDIAALQRDIEHLNRGVPQRLNYVVRSDFDLVAALGNQQVDVIFSQAAFEHFEDINKTIDQLTSVSSKDAVVVMTVDLQTHTRWVRQKDPNNIYRYPNWLYRLFNFPGIPNRVRPYEYKAAFVRNGWSDVSVRPLATMSDEELSIVQPHLYGHYKSKQSDMGYLTMLLCARRTSLSKSSTRSA